MEVFSEGFEKAFARLIGHEGNYSSNRNDKGNWTGGAVGSGVFKGTKYGIAANTYPNLDIKNLTLDDAKAIYWRDFWTRLGCDVYHAAIGFQVFDAAVNHGAGNAARFLQRAVDVADDGRIGPVTKQAVNALAVTDVLMRFNAERLDFYTKLSDWTEFSKGWARRIVGNLKYSAVDA